MRTTADKPISAQQLKALHATFHRIGMDDEARHGCIYEFTSGRTESSRELTMQEARQLLERLNPTDANDPGKACHRHEAIHNTDRCHVHPFDRLLRARHGGRRGCGTDCRRRDSAEEEAGVMMTGGVIAATR